MILFIKKKKKLGTLEISSLELTEPVPKKHNTLLKSVFTINTVTKFNQILVIAASLPTYKAHSPCQVEKILATLKKVH